MALSPTPDDRTGAPALPVPVPVLVLEGFGVAFGDRLVLADVSLQIPARGTCVLMGPAGGGKSTLLRTLAGVNHAQPDLRQWGRAFYDGRPLGEGSRPVLVHQDARYFTSTVRENLVSAFPDRGSLDRGGQSLRLAGLLARCGAEDLHAHLDEDAFSLPLGLRRLLSVLRAVSSEAPMICLDESTAGLDDEAAARILSVIRGYARDHAVFFVTHHRGQAHHIADQVVLLGGGRVQSQLSGEAFFTSDGTTIARHFLDSGGMAIPSPDALAEELGEGEPLPPLLPEVARAGPTAYVGPRDFRWMVQGQLGGLPRPGIIANLAHDLEGLLRLGVTTLVTLEEGETVPREALAAVGIAGLHFPIVDMEAPDVQIAAEWCREIANRLERGEVIAMHCRAGQGRTGTMLASQLIWSGTPAVDALELVRGINPRWVTSSEQVTFLSRFCESIRRTAPSSSRTAPSTSTEASVTTPSIVP
jgi:atypical dual specificity phosphatase